MSALRSLLTLYGALDLAVTAVRRRPGYRHDGRSISSARQRAPGMVAGDRRPLLPGRSTDRGDRDSVGGALNDILTGLEDEPPISVPTLSRMVYVLGALTHIDAAQSLSENTDLFVGVLALAAPPDTPAEERQVRAAEFLNFLTENFTGWQDWEEITHAAVLQGWLDPDIEEVPLCRPAVVTVNGLLCVVIDVEMTSSKVTLNKLKDVCDPLNWPKAYPSFFCKMENRGMRYDKWRDVLETAGFCYIPGGYLLKTALKYIKSEVSNTDARLDYDLSENQAGASLKVLVDRGYINMRCTSPDGDPGKTGVWVRTRKVAHVTDISPYAQAKMLCICGYGFAAAEMLFGPATWSNLDGFEKWEDGPLKKQGDLEKDMEEAADAVPVGQQPAPTMDAVTKIAMKWNECINYLTKTHVDLTGKWLANQLSYQELAKVSGEVGAKVASDPWQLLHELTQPPTRPQPKPPGPVEGGGP